MTGSTIKSCPVHGDYKAEILGKVKNRNLYSVCPKCEVEDAEKDRLNQENNYYEKTKALIKNSGIPKRYLSASTSQYKAKCKESDYALRVAQKYINNFRDRMESGGSLVFCGLPGTGKTHLACAIGLSALSQGYTVKYQNIFSLMLEIKATYASSEYGSTLEVIKSYISCNLLIIDEVGVQYGSNTEKILFYQILNGRYDDIKPTILISNLPESELTEYIGDRCIDRMREGGGALVPFTWESYRK